MNILVTGSDGFVGRNLVVNFKNIRDGKDCTHPDLKIDEIYEYDINSTEMELDKFCSDCDFVFNLAGVNRPKSQAEFMQGNFDFAFTLLETLKKHHNICPVMLSSSIQATLIGRYRKSEYGDRMIAACDVGMIFLDHRFTIPNFPSRLLSYMQAKLPVLACTDPNTDIGKIIVDGGFGWWCESDDVQTFCETITTIEAMESIHLASMRDRAFQYLKRNYSSEQIFELLKQHLYS